MPAGGVTQGQLHSECNQHTGCGIKMVNETTLKQWELERDEGVITEEAMFSNKVKTYDGKISDIIDEINRTYCDTENGNCDPKRKVTRIKGAEGIIKRLAMYDQNVYRATGTPRQVASTFNEFHAGRSFRWGLPLAKVECIKRVGDHGGCLNLPEGIGKTVDGYFLRDKNDLVVLRDTTYDKVMQARENYYGDGGADEKILGKLYYKVHWVKDGKPFSKSFNDLPKAREYAEKINKRAEIKKVSVRNHFKSVSDTIASGDVVKWNKLGGDFSVIGVHKNNATIQRIGHLYDDYKGAYKADIKDLTVIQKYSTGSVDIEKTRLKYAKKDIALLEKQGGMSITDTKHGLIHLSYENGVYTITNNKYIPSKENYEVLYKGDKHGAIDFVKNAYVVEQMADGGGKLAVATEIRDQLGHKALYMLGAYNMAGDEKSLSFRIKGSRNVNHIKITLNKNDQYDIQFGKILRAPDPLKAMSMSPEEYLAKTFRVVMTVKDVPVESMHAVIEKHTGLYTKLEDGGAILQEDGQHNFKDIHGKTPKVGDFIADDRKVIGKVLSFFMTDYKYVSNGYRMVVDFNDQILELNPNNKFEIIEKPDKMADGGSEVIINNEGKKINVSAEIYRQLRHSFEAGEWMAIVKDVNDKAQSVILPDNFGKMANGGSEDKIDRNLPAMEYAQHFRVMLQPKIDAHFKEHYKSTFEAGNQDKANIKDGKAYIKIDVGNSGKFMLDKKNYHLYFIKAYGQVHKEKDFGDIRDIIDFDFDYDGYSIVSKGSGKRTEFGYAGKIEDVTHATLSAMPREFGSLELELEAVPNPDFSEGSHEATIRIKKHRIKVSSIEDAKAKALQFQEENDLGSGNWKMAGIYEGGVKIGYISYNGRVWNLDGSEFRMMDHGGSAAVAGAGSGLTVVKGKSRFAAGKRHKKGDTVTTRYGTYYMDGLDSDMQKIWDTARSGGTGRQEYEMAQRNVKIVNTKHFTEDNDVAATMRSWFNDKQQPSENEVRRAMIWSYDQYGDYKIKSGGETSSDSTYISSLTTTIADPRTGEDRDVVVLKKYSKDFKEVLITIDEVQQLQDATEAPSVKKTRRHDHMVGALRLLVRHEMGLPTTTENKIAPQKWIDSLYNELANEYEVSEIQAWIKQYSDKVTADVQIPIMDDSPERKAEREARAQRQVGAANKVLHRLQSLMLKVMGDGGMEATSFLSRSRGYFIEDLKHMGLPVSEMKNSCLLAGGHVLCRMNYLDLRYYKI